MTTTIDPSAAEYIFRGLAELYRKTNPTEPLIVSECKDSRVYESVSDTTYTSALLLHPTIPPIRGKVFEIKYLRSNNILFTNVTNPTECTFIPLTIEEIVRYDITEDRLQTIEKKIMEKTW